MEIKHGDSEVGQIKLEKWVSNCLVVHARRSGNEWNIIRAELDHQDNLFSLLKRVLVVFLLHWTQYFVAGVKGKMRGWKRKRENKRRKVVIADKLLAFPNSHFKRSTEH